MELTDKEFDYFLSRLYKDLNLDISFEEFKVICNNYGWLFSKEVKL